MSIQPMGCLTKFETERHAAQLDQTRAARATSASRGIGSRSSARLIHRAAREFVPTRASALGLCFLLPRRGGGSNTGPARSRASGQLGSQWSIMDDATPLVMRARMTQIQENIRDSGAFGLAKS